MPSFEPHILGVNHQEYFAEETQKAIDQLKVKRIGVELTPRKLREFRTSGLGHWFWYIIIRGCEEKQIKLIPLVPERYSRLDPSAIRAALYQSEVTKKHSPLSALIDDVMTRTMARKAARENVDMILAGSVHAALMRKDLHIPKSKFHIIDTRDSTKKKILASVIATRRHQHERKKRTKPEPISRLKRAGLRFLHASGINRMMQRKRK